MSRKCMKCGKEATFKFVRIEDENIIDIYYCKEHAVDKSPYMKKPTVHLSEILASFLSQEAAGQPGEGGEAGLVCSRCGLPFRAYRKTLFLGCADCYESFREQLMPELRKFHGNCYHVGRKPGGGEEDFSRSGEMAPVAGDDEKPTIMIDPSILHETPPESLKPTAGEEEADPDLDAGMTLKEKIAKLTQSMNEAIRDEDYELAARCRDKIRQLREGEAAK